MLHDEKDKHDADFCINSGEICHACFTAEGTKRSSKELGEQCVSRFSVCVAAPTNLRKFDRLPLKENPFRMR